MNEPKPPEIFSFALFECKCPQKMDSNAVMHHYDWCEAGEAANAANAHFAYWWEKEHMPILSAVHSCHNDCTIAGCVARRAKERIAELEEALREIICANGFAHAYEIARAALEGK